MCAGSSKDTNLKKDLMAVRRRLRVFALTLRFTSRSVRKVPMNVASRSERVRADGDFRAALCEHEQQPERVCVGGGRVAADIALAHEALGEEALDQRGDLVGRLHGVTSHGRAAPFLPSTRGRPRDNSRYRMQAWPR